MTRAEEDFSHLGLISRVSCSFWRQMRALIVEDEMRIAGLLRRGLEEEGLAVDVAPSGSEAVWLATENPYDVIVLDVMPYTNRAGHFTGSREGFSSCNPP
ncbi:hypothetical protein BH20ACT21_BH20ACT21_23720 [soil metagenome]